MSANTHITLLINEDELRAMCHAAIEFGRADSENVAAMILETLDEIPNDHTEATIDMLPFDEDAEPWDGYNSDAEADAAVLASAGMGTDEDYGYYGE